MWELVGETVEVDGEQKPRQLSRTFSVTASKKGNLIGFISGWNGTSYTEEQFLDLDLFGQAGRACQLNVVLSDTGEYANVDSAIPLPKGIPAPQTDTPLILWNMDEWDDAALRLRPTSAGRKETGGKEGGSGTSAKPVQIPVRGLRPKPAPTA